MKFRTIIFQCDRNKRNACAKVSISARCNFILLERCREESYIIHGDEFDTLCKKSFCHEEGRMGTIPSLTSLDRTRYVTSRVPSFYRETPVIRQCRSEGGWSEGESALRKISFRLLYTGLTPKTRAADL